MPEGVLPQKLALARVKSCAARLEGLEVALLRQAERFGPVLKEALAALEAKLAAARLRAQVLEEVGPMRARLLWQELEPSVEALEDGLKDLDRIVRWVAARSAVRPEELENAYDELAGIERWFLVRLRHSAGEAVSEGQYRCCACGAFDRPGPSLVLGRCARCGGSCHHHVSS